MPRHSATPSRFRRRKTSHLRWRARRALSGPVGRLEEAAGENLYVVRLTPADVGLPPELAHPTGGYTPEVIAFWIKALGREFRGAFYAAFEVGQGDYKASGRGSLHPHVVAHRDDIPKHIRRDTRRCEPAYDLEGLLVYLHKPAESWNLEAETDYRAARRAGKLPRTRVSRCSAKRLEITRELERKATAHCTKAQTPTSTPTSTTPSTTTSTATSTTTPATTATTQATRHRKGSVGLVRRLVGLCRPDRSIDHAPPPPPRLLPAPPPPPFVVPAALDLRPATEPRISLDRRPLARLLRAAHHPHVSGRKVTGCFSAERIRGEVASSPSNPRGHHLNPGRVARDVRLARDAQSHAREPP